MNLIAEKAAKLTKDVINYRSLINLPYYLVQEAYIFEYTDLPENSPR